MIRLPSRATALMVALVLAAGCGTSASSGSPSPSNLATTATSSSPGSAPHASPTGTEAPSPTPATSPTSTEAPSPTPATSPQAGDLEWSAPLSLRSGGYCNSLSAAIDAASGYHVAAVCDDVIRYLTSRNGIADWSETKLTPPTDRVELDPQLATDGETLYLAYTRLAREEGGCGDDGLRDLGVYVRSRHLPDGAWSEPIRIGIEGDRIQAFRAVRGVIHATVGASAGGVFYVSKSGSTQTRLAIPNAVEPSPMHGDPYSTSTSLRIGDDGRARIAFSTGQAIVYARVDGGQLSSTIVAESDETYLHAPVLVLGAGDKAYLMWTQDVYQGGGCARDGPGPLDGTYFGTDASGAWMSSRLLRMIGGKAFTLAPSTGRVHAIIMVGSTPAYLTKVGDGDWTTTMLSDSKSSYNPVIRLDPATAKPVLFGLVGEGGITVTSKR